MTGSPAAGGAGSFAGATGAVLPGPAGCGRLLSSTPPLESWAFGLAVWRIFTAVARFTGTPPAPLGAAASAGNGSSSGARYRWPFEQVRNTPGLARVWRSAEHSGQVAVLSIAIATGLEPAARCVSVAHIKGGRPMPRKNLYIPAWLARRQSLERPNLNLSQVFNRALIAELDGDEAVYLCDRCRELAAKTYRPLAPPQPGEPGAA